MQTYPTIPDPTSDPTTHEAILRAIKSTVEMLTGQRSGGVAPAMRLFRSEVQPGASNSPVSVKALREGDAWIDMANSAKLHYWDPTTKVWIPTT